MSDPEFRLPPTDNVHVPDTAEVIKRLSDGTIGEISDPELSVGGLRTVFVGRPVPEASDDILVDQQGDIVYPFAQKFGKSAEGWRIGDVVKVTARVVGNDEGGVDLRSCMSDARYDDVYKLDPAEQATMAGHGLARLDVDVQVAGEREPFVFSNVRMYPARIQRINSVEKPWDGEQPIDGHETVLAEGEVVEYAPRSWSDQHKEVPGVLVLRLPSGQKVDIAVNDYIHMSRGVIDVIIPSAPVPGEVVQVHLYANDGGRGRVFGTAGPVEKSLQTATEAYLVKADPERLTEYTQRREAIAAGMSNLETLDGAAFRQAAAALIRDNLDIRYVPESVFVTSLMSRKEQVALLSLIDKKFPNKVDGSPDPEGMYLSSSNQISLGWFIEVGDALAADILAMNRREYYEFCEDLVTRQRSCEPQTYVRPYPLSYLNRDFTPEQRLALVHKGCETWIPYIQGKTVLDRGVAVVDTEAQLAYHEESAFMWIINELASLSQRYAPAQEYAKLIAPLLSENHRWKFQFSRDVARNPLE